MWTFSRTPSGRWALVEVENTPIYARQGQGSRAGREPGSLKDPVRYSPGYESKNFGDILAASMYLNSGYKGSLSERTMQILDQFKVEAAECISKN